MRNLTLLTDLYELTMAYGFYRHKKHEEEAVFDIFFRQNKLITYSLAAGLQQAMDYLLNWRFSAEDMDYLRSLKLFEEGFLRYLEKMRFTGDVYAVREGEPVFPGEPILTVKAPLIQAQFAETALLNIINHQTLIATKASKICRAAGEGAVMEFGLRRAQGPDAGIYGARAAVIGGCSSTSNVIAASPTQSRYLRNSLPRGTGRGAYVSTAEILRIFPKRRAKCWTRRVFPTRSSAPRATSTNIR